MTTLVTIRSVTPSFKITFDPPFANNRTNPGNGNFTTFLYRCFYSPGRVVFYHKRYQTLFLGLFNLKKRKKISKFWPKPWTNPFGKMPILRLLFIVQKCQFPIQNVTKPFLGGILSKKRKSRNFIILAKPWTNPFRKLPILRLFLIHVFIVQQCQFSIQNVTNTFLAYFT